MADWQVVDSKQKKLEKQAQRRVAKEERLCLEKEEKERTLREALGPTLLDDLDSDDDDNDGRSKRRGDAEEESYKAFAWQVEDEEKKRRASEKKRQQQMVKGPKRLGNKSKKSLQMAFQTIDHVALSACMKDATQRYPDNVDIQLKAVADFFETKIGVVQAPPAPGPAINSLENYISSLDYPACHLPSTVPKALGEWLDITPTSEICYFFWFLVRQLTVNGSAEFEKEEIPTSGYGILVVIQLIARRYSGVVLRNTEAMRAYTHPKTRLLRSEDAPLLLWIFGQMLDQSPKNALQSWYLFLLPLLTKPSTRNEYRDVALVYIKHLLRHKLDDISKISPREPVCVAGLERLLLLLYSSTAPNSEKQLLAKAYRKLKTVSLTHDDTAPRHFFAMLLAHAATDNKPLREEILRSLVSCFERDQSCFVLWKKVYLRFVAQTNNLILHLMLNWNRLHPKITGTELLELIQHFIAINKHLIVNNIPPKELLGETEYKGAVEKRDIKMCTITCKALEKKMTYKWHKGKSFLFTISLIMLLFTVYFLWQCRETQCAASDWCDTVVNCAKYAQDSGPLIEAGDGVGHAAGGTGANDEL